MQSLSSNQAARREGDGGPGTRVRLMQGNYAGFQRRVWKGPHEGTTDAQELHEPSEKRFKAYELLCGPRQCRKHEQERQEPRRGGCA